LDAAEDDDDDVTSDPGPYDEGNYNDGDDGPDLGPSTQKPLSAKGYTRFNLLCITSYRLKYILSISRKVAAELQKTSVLVSRAAATGSIFVAN
jgi:hypothetical protein